MSNDRKVSSASALGQNHGAVARAAIINAALTVRDTVANKVAPAAKTGGSKVTTGAKAGLAYGVGFVRNLVGK